MAAKKYLVLALSILLVASFASAKIYYRVAGGVASGEAPSCTTDNDSQLVAFSDETTNASRTSTDTVWYGQYFELASAATITGVSFEAQRYGTSGTYNLYLYEYDTTSDAPTGDVLATHSADVSALPGSATETFFEFSSYPELSAGDYIVYAVGPDASNGVGWSRSLNDINGTYMYYNGSSWSENASYDMRGLGIYGCE